MVKMATETRSCIQWIKILIQTRQIRYARTVCWQCLYLAPSIHLSTHIQRDKLASENSMEWYGSYRMHNYLFCCVANHLINQFFMCFVFVTRLFEKKTTHELAAIWRLDWVRERAEIKGNTFNLCNYLFLPDALLLKKEMKFNELFLARSMIFFSRISVARKMIIFKWEGWIN